MGGDFVCPACGSCRAMMAEFVLDEPGRPVRFTATGRRQLGWAARAVLDRSPCAAERAAAVRLHRWARPERAVPGTVTRHCDCGHPDEDRLEAEGGSWLPVMASPSEVLDALAVADAAARLPGSAEDRERAERLRRDLVAARAAPARPRGCSSVVTEPLGDPVTGRPGPVVLSLCPGCQARLAEHDDAEPRVWLRASAANTLLRLADPRVSPPTDARSVAAEEFLAEVGAAAWADVLRLHHREFVLPELLGMDPGEDDEDDDQPPRPVDFSRLLWPMCAPPASALGWATRRPSRWSAYQP